MLGMGGGRGRYRSVSGDVPVSMQCKYSTTCAGSAMPSATLATLADAAAETQGDAQQGACGIEIATTGRGRETLLLTKNIILLAKNVRALTSEERIRELLFELNSVQWDFVFLTETWRMETREILQLQTGEIFCGSGSENATRGVGFVVNKRWARNLKQFQCIDERVAFMDISADGTDYRLIVTYFPHSGYADYHVERLYSILSELHLEAKDKRLEIIIGGDFNADVGSHTEGDDCRVVGMHGLNEENSRGQWLKHWATKERLMLTNTFFSKTPQLRTTLVGPNGRPRQLDYFLAPISLRRSVQDAVSTSVPDMGSDHSTIKLVIRRKDGRTQKSNARYRVSSGWCSVDTGLYLKSLQDLLGDLETDFNLQSRAEEIEKASVQATPNSQMAGPQVQDHQADEMIRLEELLQRRRDLWSEQRAERAQISYLIKKELRTMRRKRQQCEIGKILDDFKGLKRISAIKSVTKKRYITGMIDKEDCLQTDRRTIADVFADFYSELYTSTTSALLSAELPDEREEMVPPFDQSELQKALLQLKNGRSPDGTGVLAEMLKAGGAPLASILLDLYNHILSPDSLPPNSWKKTVMTVIFK